MSFYGKQCSLQAFPLRPQHAGIEIPHWQSGEMERPVFSKAYSSSSLTLIRNKLLTTVFSKTVKSFPSHLLPRVQGLLRQLVLVPGSDATSQICPSSKPQLAALSVPPLLSDLPVMGREGDGRLTSYGNLQTRFTRHLIQYDGRHGVNAFLCMFSCFPLHCLLVFWSWTVRNTGASVCGVGAVVLRATARPAVVQSAQERPLSLRWYSVDRCARGWESNINHPLLSKSLLSAQIENSQKFHLSFYSDHKRLDYVLEHQVLSTSSETHDVEVSFHFVKKKNLYLSIFVVSILLLGSSLYP